MNEAELIVSFARSAIGLKEIPGNMGFEKDWFERMMIARGFKEGDAWCALFAEFIYFEVYHSTPYEKLINDLFSKSAVETYYNFLRNGTFKVKHQPTPGSIVCWRYYRLGKKTWKGHVGIVMPKIGKTYFETVEGNGNSQGGREGLEVVLRRRDYSVPDTGIRILGFIYPINIET